MTNVKTIKAKDAKKNNIGLIAGIITAVVVVIVAVVCILLNAKPGIVGKYELSASISDGKESTELVSFMKALGGTQTIEFKKDKTGELKSEAGEASSTQTFTYDDKQVKMKVNSEDGEESQEVVWDLEYKEDTVTIIKDGDGMKFTRIKE